MLTLFEKPSRAATARRALKQAKSNMRNAFGRIAEASGDAAREMAATAEKLREAELRMIEASRGYVRANPLKSSAITLALGAVAATLFIAARRR